MQASNRYDVFMRLIPLLLVLTATIVVNGCMRMYKLDIQQGNVVTENQLAQLRPGMNKRDVRYVLGTPLVVDPFHEDRWDYYYSFKPGNKKRPEQRRVTLVFSNGALERIEGDIVAANADTAQPAEDESIGGTKVSERRSKEKGFFGRTWDKIFNK